MALCCRSAQLEAASWGQEQRPLPASQPLAAQLHQGSHQQLSCYQRSRLRVWTQAKLQSSS